MPATQNIERSALTHGLGAYAEDETCLARMDGWIADYNAMPQELRFYLDMFIVMLPKSRSIHGTTTNRLKEACSARWGLYYPKTIWFVAARLHGFKTSAPVPSANGAFVNASLKSLKPLSNPSDQALHSHLWLPDLYTQWEVNRGRKEYAA